MFFIAVIYCGPTEWRFERRRGSSIDRKNTVRHLIQMMAITEEGGGTSPIPQQMREEDEEGDNEEEKQPAISKSLPAQATVPPPYCKSYIFYIHKVTNAIIWILGLIHCINI